MRYVWLSVGAEAEVIAQHLYSLRITLATHDRMNVDIDVPSSVLCIRCFRLLDKCIKLKRELDLAEQEAAACVKVMSDTYTAPSVSSEVHTPVQRKRSSDNRSDLVNNQLSPAVSVR